MEIKRKELGYGYCVLSLLTVYCFGIISGHWQLKSTFTPCFNQGQLSSLSSYTAQKKHVLEAGRVASRGSLRRQPDITHQSMAHPSKFLHSSTPQPSDTQDEIRANRQ